MIAARWAMLLIAGAGWHGIVLLAGRAEGVGLATTLALGAALGWLSVRARHDVAPARLVAGLLLIAAAPLTGVALVEIGAVVAALLWCAMPRLRWPALALALLALPILPTLDVLAAYPLRRVSAMLTVAMLRLNGIGVGLEGVALRWHGRELLFDGPCSGVRMLWATLVLACVLAMVRRARPAAFAAILAGAVGVAILGNALRAASLFYLEEGFVALPGDAAMHEVVGLAAFALVAAAAMALPMRRSART
ncbi:archaeosortase/exosortase family protein [Sphingomonas donggukensis]|uniref:Archaeosortase/exosortase family protein n=1 Tax=Sphingomonas donggukensis TaxID=2949093 RepID=A0ABY4TUW5_9SPHN|nr:archaeosortase/exosortase family protein [Sphingomonas donggukensis]URW76190.1 archaeosortase/exosortase family protein [Sphingomonas donggukensis]